MTRIVTILLLLSPAAWGQSYSYDMYRRALEDQTTAPLYVLVSFRGDGVATERVACVLAPFLLGAIHREYGLGYDEAGIRRALDIAIAQPGRLFSFREDALANFPPAYPPEALAAVRQRVAAMSNLELREALSDRRSPLRAVADQPMFRDAVAHVLLERGILVGSADPTGQLYLAE